MDLHDGATKTPRTPQRRSRAKHLRVVRKPQGTPLPASVEALAALVAEGKPPRPPGLTEAELAALIERNRGPQPPGPPGWEPSGGPPEVVAFLATRAAWLASAWTEGPAISAGPAKLYSAATAALLDLLARSGGQVEAAGYLYSIDARSGGVTIRQG